MGTRAHARMHTREVVEPGRSFSSVGPAAVGGLSHAPRCLWAGPSALPPPPRHRSFVCGAHLTCPAPPVVLLQERDSRYRRGSSSGRRPFGQGPDVSPRSRRSQWLNLSPPGRPGAATDGLGNLPPRGHQDAGQRIGEGEPVTKGLTMTTNVHSNQGRGTRKVRSKTGPGLWCRGHGDFPIAAAELDALDSLTKVGRAGRPTGPEWDREGSRPSSPRGRSDQQSRPLTSDLTPCMLT